MKYLLIFCFSIGSVMTSAQIPDYLGNNPSWSSMKWDDDIFGTTEDYRNHFTSGDTIIGAYTYKIMKSAWNGGDTLFYSFWRQEGRKIYEYQSGADQLLYSFDLSIGDTLPMSGSNHIEKIDSILVGSDYRYVFYVDTANSYIYLIEGIGLLNAPFDCRGMFPGDLWTANAYEGALHWGGWWGLELYSYSENGVIVWENASCSSLAVEETEDVSFSVYPVPASNTITIQAGVREMQQVELLDLNGRIIHREFCSGLQHEMNIAALENGFYLLRVTFNNDVTAITQIVKS